MALELLGAHCVGYVEPTKSWVVLPGTIKAELNDVRREAMTLNDDISSWQNDAPEFVAFKKAWFAFLAGFSEFYEDTAKGIGGWFSRVWGSSADRTRDYGNQLNDWRARFVKLGGKPTEPPASERPGDKNRETAKKVVTGVLIVTGIFAGGYAVSKLTAAGRLFKPDGRAP